MVAFIIIAGTIPGENGSTWMTADDSDIEDKTCTPINYELVTELKLESLG